MSASAKYILLVIFGLSLMPEFAFSQGNEDPVFTAYADAKEVLLNSYFEVTFTLKNGEGREFTPPDFRDFKVLSGPNREFRKHIRNGRIIQETSIGYGLQALRNGALIIGSAEIRVDGQKFQTDSVRIHVLKNEVEYNEGAPEAFLLTQLKQAEAFLGQQVILDYVLYEQAEKTHLNLVSKPDYEGFTYRYSSVYLHPVLRKRHNGVQYKTRILSRVLLYPEQTGVLMIDSLCISVGVPVLPENPSKSSSVNPELRLIPVGSPVDSIEVKPLKQPLPDNFSGIIGDYSLHANLSDQESSINDTISLYLILNGEGNLNYAGAPKLNFLVEFELLETKFIKQRDMVLEGTGFEYLLIPKEEGNFTIRPEVVIFYPESETYQKLQVEGMPLVVRGRNDK